MKRVTLVLLLKLTCSIALNLDFLDPKKLQTKTPPLIQQQTALEVINNITRNAVLVTVYVNPIIFSDNKDAFTISSVKNELHIRASSGVAAVWGFNYYLKKYLKNHIGWQVQNILIPNTLPTVDETVVARDRFRYYQNVCTASYSFLWWTVDQWMDHLRWMALNGINLALAPVAQEAAWTRIYRQFGMTEDEINEYFTGPAFLAWLRMGNVHGWGGPLMQSWHDHQRKIQDTIIDYMYKLGMIPVLPAFSGHVPRAFARIFPNTSFYDVKPWSNFKNDYCCGLFLNPSEPLFNTIGKLFLRETAVGPITSNVYYADPFNEIEVQPWSTDMVQGAAEAIFVTLNETDHKAVWLLQNWMFIHKPDLWPLKRVKSFLTTVPNGRLLILDLQSELSPQFDLYQMYFGQPFIWCMLHNFGGTSGMFGNLKTLNHDVFETRKRHNTTMIGTGLTPEGINQNYVVYDFMLETAWRKEPVTDIEEWVAEYAERRYGCNATSQAWKYLLRSVYSFNGIKPIHGKYVITRRPSFKLNPTAWYKSKDLFKAFELFVTVPKDTCDDRVTIGYVYDLVDVTRQALQYRAEQIYRNLLRDRFSNTWVFNSTISQFLGIMGDIEDILGSNGYFTAKNWLQSAQNLAKNNIEAYYYQLNARNQITLWGPNGEISDYACKQWAELFHYYYIPRWTHFLNAALDASIKNENFDEKSTQRVIKATVEKQFQYLQIDYVPSHGGDARNLALSLYQKWSNIPGLEDLPFCITKSDLKKSSSLSDSQEDESFKTPTVVMLQSTTPL